ncbi:MAG: N-acetyltransferase [Burkholderiales bacterium]|nr:N-acetyltransferase [Anaerolineae bacterium]
MQQTKRITLHERNMNLDKLRQIYDQEQRMDVIYPDTERMVVPDVVRMIDRAGHEGMVLHSSLTDDNIDAIIEREIAYFTSIGQGFEWKVFEHDYPADLKERLGARGFIIEDEEAILMLDLEDAPEALFRPVTQDVRQITAADEMFEAFRVQNRVWGEDYDWLAERLANDLRANPDYLSVFVAYADGLPVCSAWVNFPSGNRFAGLWGGSTLPEYRGRGLYSALVNVRAQLARERGRRFLTVDASPMSLPILQKFGFQRISTAFPCKWPPPTGAEG